MADEYRLERDGLAAIGRAIRTSEATGGLTQAVATIQQLAAQLVGYAGNDQYSAGFADAVDQLTDDIATAQTNAATAIAAIAQDIDAMVITGVSSDEAAADALSKVNALLQQFQHAANGGA